MRAIHAASCAVMERDTPPEWSATCSCGATARPQTGDPFAFGDTNTAAPLTVTIND